LTIERSARGEIVVSSLSLLFALLGSDVVEETEAVLVTVPDPVAVATTVMVGVAPGETVPSGHVTVPPAWEHDPWDGVAET
jgi:hypothetical protein